ncbi:hypothetical protein [Flavobacterium selenitireducens]|uniref:hypothetical protein n=1 Tax=Flavobacterium selenitireducens TaxID=2722704 RepID=UPI00168A9342|nr:hypothetical protein [Flavobacterium selenitireducens]MBD3582997.1 hypothetical protein [Flavobacterium selenitireducens]
MKKIICFAAIALTFFGCADDDTAATASEPKPISVTTHIENGLSQTRSFTYDAKGRLATLSKSGETVTFSYDENNLVRRVKSSSKNYYLNYDANGKFTEFFNATDNEVVEFYHQGDNNYLTDGIFLAFHTNGDWRVFDYRDFTYSEGKGPFANVKHLNMLAVTLADEGALRYCAIKRRQTFAMDGVSIAYECAEAPADLPTSERLGETRYSYQYE